MLKIKATFIGTDSLGYENGKEYVLFVHAGKWIQRADGTGSCEYESIKAFMVNWDKIEHVK